MRKLLMLALLVSILMGAMLPAIGLGGNNAIITQTQVATASRDNNAVVTQMQIAMVSGGNNVDQYTNTTVIPEFGPDIWCKWYNTVIKKALGVLPSSAAESRNNWIQISGVGVYCSG